MGIWNRLCGGADIVQFDDGKYGILMGVFNPRFIDADSQVWYTPEFVRKWAQFETPQEARVIASRYRSLGYKEVKPE